MIPASGDEVNAMLYARGLAPKDYEPTLADATAAVLRLFDDPPFTIKQVKL